MNIYDIKVYALLQIHTLEYVMVSFMVTFDEAPGLISRLNKSTVIRGQFPVLNF